MHIDACSTLSLRAPQWGSPQSLAVVTCLITRHLSLRSCLLSPLPCPRAPAKSTICSQICLCRVCFWEIQTRTSSMPAPQGCVPDSTCFLPNAYSPGGGFGDLSPRKELGSPASVLRIPEHAPCAPEINIVGRVETYPHFTASQKNSHIQLCGAPALRATMSNGYGWQGTRRSNELPTPVLLRARNEVIVDGSWTWFRKQNCTVRKLFGCLVFFPQDPI